MMIEKSAALVLSSLRYGDHSLIVRMFTERWGTLSFMVPGVRKSRSRMPAALFQALTCLEISCQYDERRDLQRLHDIRCLQAYTTLHQDFLKSNLVVFLSEVLTKSLREAPSDRALFSFIVERLFLLDGLSEAYEDFHLSFLADLSHHLGFLPILEDPLPSYFDLREAHFVSCRPAHPDVLEGSLCRAFANLYDRRAGFSAQGQRSLLLSSLIRYYGLHIPNFEPLRSREVLHDVWSS